MVWEPGNRLAGALGDGVNERYLYDADGLRVQKTSGETATYSPFPHYQVTVAASGTVTTTAYYHFNGQPVAMRTGGTLTHLHTDHLGSIALTTGGSTVDQRYFAYGRKRGGGTLPSEHNYTGQRKDASGLLYYNARYYDPQLGTFISPDTIVLDPGVLFDYNRYGYVRGNPLKYNDPSGHTPCAGCTIDLRPILVMFEDVGLLNPVAPAYMVPVSMGEFQKVRQTQTGEAPDPALALTTEWYFEAGEQNRYYDSESEITQTLMSDEGVVRARQAFVDGGRQSMTEVDSSWYEHSFGLRDAARELGDVVSDGNWATSFLGGYQVEVIDLGDSMVEFRVHNTTGWASATRVWGWSFKDDETRSDFGPGGNLEQVYIWQEEIPE